MKVITKIEDIKDIIIHKKKEGKTVGFVPTMGYLHDGHISLVKTSTLDNDFTVMSIFVNPTQFGVNEDFNKYPKDLERDSQIAEISGVDVIFAPSVEEMYPHGYKSYVDVEDITGILCGKSRKGHFRGVTTVVNKLFNIIQPDKAYFGQKDAQQAVVLKKMVKDLNMNLEIVTCPLIRETDGLALSSRNIYLSPDERKSALVLSKSLFAAKEMILNGEKNKEKIISFIKNNINSEKSAAIEYVEIVNADNLDAVQELKGSVLIALAVRFGLTRLIDNVIVGV